MEVGGTALYWLRLNSWPPTHISVVGSSPNDRWRPLTTNPPAIVPRPVAAEEMPGSDQSRVPISAAAVTPVIAPLNRVRRLTTLRLRCADHSSWCSANGRTARGSGMGRRYRPASANPERKTHLSHDDYPMFPI